MDSEDEEEGLTAWRVATYARIKPNAEGETQVPYTVHGRSERPLAGRALQLLTSPFGVAGATGSNGSDEWELASGWVGRGRGTQKLSWQFDEVHTSISSRCYNSNLVLKL